MESVPEVGFTLTDPRGAGSAETGLDFEVQWRLYQHGWEIWHNPDMELDHEIPAERLEKKYLRDFFRENGIYRYHVRMLRFNSWQRPFATVAYWGGPLETHPAGLDLPVKSLYESVFGGVSTYDLVHISRTVSGGLISVILTIRRKERPRQLERPGGSKRDNEDSIRPSSDADHWITGLKKTEARMNEDAEGEAVPVSVLVPTRNEEENLPRCLAPLRGWADEIVVVDSQSTDDTVAIAEEAGAEVIQFYYNGGWPKKRQWALDTYAFDNEWILLLDADEVLLDPIKQEIAGAIQTDVYDGYWLRFQLHFLGRQLRYGGFDLWKLFLFRNGKGRYERRFEGQDELMSDIEVHEHVVVDGKVGRLSNPIRHENWNSLYRYIEKHNEYSEWEAKMYHEGDEGTVEPALFGNQAQRRRWLKQALIRVPGFPLLTFVYHYVLRLGFLDGKPGLIYCAFKGIQRFHAKAKWYELRQSEKTSGKI